MMEPGTAYVSVRNRRVSLLGSTALIAMITMPQAALAQTAPAAANAADTPAAVTTKAEDANPVAKSVVGSDAVDDAAQAAEVVITGSSIRGVAPTGSNLIAVSRDTIAAVAPANTSELLASIPQLGNFNANQEQSTSNRFRTPGFQANIHNLGIYATLTLFNGHRMAPVGGEAVFPDSSIIPVIALQRVEVIADGASAVYGSDAVAGVVNFIYRKDVDGLEASATYGLSADNPYRKYDASAIWGKKWSTGGVMVAYEYSQNRSPKNEDIDFIHANQLDRGGRDLRSTVCAQPNVKIGNTTYGSVGTAGTLATAQNTCETALLNSIIPDGRRHAVLATAHQELGSNVEVWTELNYSNYRTHRVSGPRTITLAIPTTSPNFRSFPGATPAACPGGVGLCETVTRSGLGLFDNPRGIQSSEELAFTGGVDIKLGGDWSATVMTHYSKTNDFNSDPEVDLAVAQGLANSGAFNLYGQAADNQAVLSQINNGYTQANNAHQYLREIQAKADGPLFHISGGDVRVAVGTDFREDQAVQLQTGGAAGIDQLTVRDDNISRTIAALFAEIHVPLFSEDNAIPGFHKLDLSMSGRYDHYQNLGGTFNPKFGFVWEPISSLALRGSYGKSFVAPNLGMITSTFSVPQAGSSIAGIGTVNVLNIGGGNPDLTPERARTYSLGADFKPVFLRGFRASGTYYYVHYANLLYKPTTADAFFDPAFADSIIRPSAPGVPLPAALIAQLLALYPPQSPSPPTYDYVFRSYTINVGVRKISGLDFETSYQFSTPSMGQFALAANANRQLHYKQKISPTGSFTDLVDTFNAVKWKGRVSASWNLDPFTVSVFDNYTGTYLNTTVTPAQRTKAYNTIDLVASYKLNILKGAQIQVRASNLFDKKPPFYDNNLGYNGTYASPFGRLLEATLRLKI